jgi:hypothetical protein
MSFRCCHVGTISIVYMISLMACVADVHLYHMGSWGAEDRASGRAPTAPVGRYAVLFHVFQGSTPPSVLMTGMVDGILRGGHDG